MMLGGAPSRTHARTAVPDAVPGAPLGRQLLLELYDCDIKCINDVRRVEKIMISAAKAAKAHIVDSVFHTFNPHGVSGVVVIAESHLAVHTWPEYNFASIDIYTCGNDADPWKALEVLKRSFKARRHEIVELQRGLLDKINQTPAAPALASGLASQTLPY